MGQLKLDIFADRLHHCKRCRCYPIFETGVDMGRPVILRMKIAALPLLHQLSVRQPSYQPELPAHCNGGVWLRVELLTTSVKSTTEMNLVFCGLQAVVGLRYWKIKTKVRQK